MSNQNNKKLNPYKRYQAGLSIGDLYPSVSNVCACGCGKQLKGKQRKWASKECRLTALYNFYIVKGDTSVIRDILLERDGGFCQHCGVLDENWQADHIIPVFKGGGSCLIDNYQTLCTDCHKEKTYLDRLPDCCNIQARSLDVIPPPFDGFWTANQRLSPHIIGQAV